MTKHELVDQTLKCRLDTEPCKVDLGSVGKMLEDNAFVIRDVEVTPRRTQRRKGVDIAEEGLKLSKLGKTANKLYDLDPACGTEKPLKIDLDLYQMEGV